MMHIILPSAHCTAYCFGSQHRYINHRDSCRAIWLSGNGVGHIHEIYSTITLS